ncbi:MAG: hypothetical protein KME19_01665 [Microcoleus vaginatus WJT46-NPBG5]|jgi:competence protein ComGC|nr:hypothetical protein [Microcoleus vaginatus WJT46-NPBG5]
MNTNFLAFNLLSDSNNNNNKGFTNFDLLAHLFVIVILLMAVPMLFFPSQPGSEPVYRAGQTVLIRFKY